MILTVKAIDRDPGENGRVSYHLKVGNQNTQETEEFSIDQETGELRSKIILDREVKSKFEVNSNSRVRTNDFRRRLHLKIK